MFSPAHVTTLFPARSRARALESWREAAMLVGTRWRAFVEAESASRAGAFASYLAALDVEEAAAADLAALSPSVVAA
jgi:hypothetical protein